LFLHQARIHIDGSTTPTLGSFQAPQFTLAVAQPQNCYDQICCIVLLIALPKFLIKRTILANKSVVNKFLFNNQPGALIIQIYSVIKLYVSGNFSAHHQEFSAVHSALVSFVQVLMTTSKQSQDGTQFHPDSIKKKSLTTHGDMNVKL
jgi:hypothetical protein